MSLRGRYYDQQIHSGEKMTQDMIPEEEKIPVLCCCSPENQLGELPASSSALPRRVAIDEQGNESMAFDSGHQSLEELQQIPEFVSATQPSKKTWKTWKK